ncbi:hypothetical protein EJB05_11315, partial [Eragrostis curvula]
MHAFPTSDNVPAREISCRQQDAGRDREEKSGGEWPQGILSIGTLGNESPAARGGGGRRVVAAAGRRAGLHDRGGEEAAGRAEQAAPARQVQVHAPRGSAATDDDRQLPLDRFLNCPSSLEVDRRLSLRHAAGENGEFSPDTQIILSKARDLLVNSNGAAIKQKSFKFLLKKMFACRGGFGPAPTLKDPVESRMEKLFRTMLQKKMSARPSSANAASSRKYYLEDKPSGRMQRDRRLGEEERMMIRALTASSGTKQTRTNMVPQEA